MSHQSAPFPSSIFNSNNFTATDPLAGGTPMPGPAIYVEYPTAQGANTLISTTINNSLTVGGTSSFNGIVNLNNTVTANALITGTITDSQNSTNASNLAITNDVSNANFKLPMITNNLTGVYPMYAGGALTFNPTSGSLTTTTFVVALAGN